jgi:hypothetical protein
MLNWSTPTVMTGTVSLGTKELAASLMRAGELFEGEKVLLASGGRDFGCLSASLFLWVQVPQKSSSSDCYCLSNL